MDRRIYIRWILLAILLVFIWTAMALVDVSEMYAMRVYPSLSYILSRFSSLFPFSVGDCFIVGSIAGLIIYLVYSLVKREKLGRTLRHIVEYLVWVYVWFYLAWGLNYFRHDFYTRSGIQPVKYATEEFKSFLYSYTDSLHVTFTNVGVIDQPLVTEEIKKNYRALPSKLGLVKPADYMKAKPMLSSSFMSKVGVKGYMGPFFTEFNLNRNLPFISYPSTYAHEMAHALGITSEAEANLYAYLICIASEVPEIRFSGYYSLFTYVIGSAKRLLSTEDFQTWLDSVDPKIKQLYNEQYAYWQSLYDPVIGDIQERVYNVFLKGNNISSGTANYSQVIGLVMSLYSSKSNSLHFQ